jgi:OPA family sugar phosphate sensor protein UhpC-like MFS transporter
VRDRVSQSGREALNPRYERWRWLTFGITWLIYAGFYFTRQSFGVAKAAIEKAPNVALTRAHQGDVDSAYGATYMLGQFVFGALGDRFGPKRILLGGMALSILAAVAMGFSTTFAAFMAFSVAQGIAQSTGWSNTAKVMSSWFSVRERGRVIGWWCTHYTVGSAAALAFAGWMMKFWGTMESGGASSPSLVPYWPAAFWGPAIVLTGILLLTWLLLRNRPEDVGLPPIDSYHREPATSAEEIERADPNAGSAWTKIAEVLASRRIWLLAVAYFSVKLTRYVFYYWGPRYVNDSLGSDSFESALTAAVMPIGGLVGVIVTGYLSDKVFGSRRAPVMILSLLATVAVLLVGIYPIHNIWLMSAFFFAVGVFLFGPDSLISATASIDFGTKRGAGTAAGFVNGVGSIGGILAGTLTGRITTEGNWKPIFLVMLVGLAVSIVVLLPLWRVKPPRS